MVYHATFPNGALDSGFADSLHTPQQAMKIGEADAAALGIYGAPPTASGALGLILTAPDTIPDGQTPSVGVFSTDLNFGMRSIFVVRATFQRLHGKTFKPKAGETNAWAVGVAARTGDERDLALEKRVGVTFRVRDDGPMLSIQWSPTAPALIKEKVRPDLAARIFSTDPSGAFTLELVINRQACTVGATLTVAGEKPQQLSSNLPIFQAESGPPVTTVGATLADCCAPKATVNAEIRDFQILVPGVLSTEPNVPAPPPINPH